jgi:pimeloyl-ACP methyl ester carboxylesterase
MEERTTVIRSKRPPYLIYVLAVMCVCSSQTATHAQELRRSGFLGVQVVAVPEAVRADLGLPTDAGVLVQALVDGGSAKSAGIEQDDVITDVGDHRVTGVADFVQVARGLREGDTSAVRVRRRRASITVSVLVRPRPYERASDVNVEYRSITVDGTLRRTIITAPTKPGRHPAVLYVSGIGCFSQESLDITSNDAKLLYGLTRAGFVTMRVEKSGMGDSEGPACISPAVDFRAELRGYVAGLRALKQLSFVDPNAVFLVGLSLGGVEAPILAAEEEVRAVVVVNTVAKPLFEYLLDTRRRQMVLEHRPYDETDRSMLLDERCNHRLLIEKQEPDAILAETPGCADHIQYPAPFTLLQQWADVNVAAAWKAVDRPVLIVFGTSDYVSTIADNPYLAAVINAFHPGAATVASIPNMDHGLSHATSMADSFARKTPGEFEPAVLETIATWLRAHIPA